MILTLGYFSRNCRIVIHPEVIPSLPNLPGGTMLPHVMPLGSTGSDSVNPMTLYHSVERLPINFKKAGGRLLIPTRMSQCSRHVPTLHSRKWKDFLWFVDTQF